MSARNERSRPAVAALHEQDVEDRRPTFREVVRSERFRPRTVRPLWLQHDLASLDAIVGRLTKADLGLDDIDEIARIVQPLWPDLLLKADRIVRPSKGAR